MNRQELNEQQEYAETIIRVIKCEECDIPISDPGEYPDPAALLCDTCYENVSRADEQSAGGCAK